MQEERVKKKRIKRERLARKLQINPQEAILLEYMREPLESLSLDKRPEEQLDKFLDQLNMPKEDEMFRESFLIGCYVKKINYESIILELRKKYPNLAMSEDAIQDYLKEVFNNWMEKYYPKLRKKSTNISIMTFIRVFEKRVIF